MRKSKKRVKIDKADVMESIAIIAGIIVLVLALALSGTIVHSIRGPIVIGLDTNSISY